MVERVVHVVGGGGDEFLAGGDGEVEAQLLVVPEQGGEYRAGLRDERDAAFGQLVGTVERERAEPLLDVVEAHAVAADDRKVGGQGEVADALAEAGLGGVVGREHAPRDDEPTDTEVDGEADLGFELRVADAEDREVGHLGEVGESGVAVEPLDLVVLRVDGVHGAGKA